MNKYQLYTLGGALLAAVGLCGPAQAASAAMFKAQQSPAPIVLVISCPTNHTAGMTARMAALTARGGGIVIAQSATYDEPIPATNSVASDGGSVIIGIVALRSETSARFFVVNKAPTLDIGHSPARQLPMRTWFLTTTSLAHDGSFRGARVGHPADVGARSSGIRPAIYVRFNRPAGGTRLTVT